MKLNTSTMLRMHQSELVSDRMLHEDTWQECLDHGMPHRGDITTLRAEGSDRHVGIYDSTMTTRATDFVNMTKASAFPSGSTWIVFSPKRADREDFSIRSALYEGQERQKEAMEDSNFYAAVAVFLGDLAVIGNACMYIREGRFKLQGDGTTFGGLVYEPVPMRDISWEFGPDGWPVAVYRDFSMPAYQAAEFFRNPGEKVTEAIEAENHGAAVHYTHAVHWNRGIFADKTVRKPWVSRVFEREASGEAQVIETGGFLKNPYVCARWMVMDGERYGRGPGHQARPDAKGLNESNRMTRQAMAEVMDPSLGLPSEHYYGSNFGHGGHFIFRAEDGPDRRPFWFNKDIDLAKSEFMMQRDEDSIGRAFYSSILENPETQPRSAEESRRIRFRDNLRFATPADRVEHEAARPIAESTFSIMSEAGQQPEMEDLARERGGRLGFEFSFVSPFFQSQKQEMAERARLWAIGQYELTNVTGDPSHADQVNPDRLAQYVQSETDIPLEVVNTPAEIEEIRAARAEQQARQQQLEDLGARSEAAKNLSPLIEAQQ